MMADLVVAMNSIVEERLPRLLRRLVSGVSSRDFKLFRSQFNDIHDQINACCKSLGNSDDEARAWVTQARELAYDMDDWFDLFYLCIYHVDTGGNLSSSSSCFLNWFRGRNDIPHKLRDLEARFKALKEGRPSILDGGALPVDTLQLINTKCLVGLEADIDEVTRMVTDAGDNAELKIVSITGMAGSGKTTLAATVYQRLGEQNGFQCRAFVSAALKQDLRRILKELLSQLGVGDDHNGNEEIHKLEKGLRNLLKKKRYLIVLDNLWSSEHWEEIKVCLPENNLASRIITTTRNNELALKCCYGSSDYIHKIGLLSDADSKQLFLKQLETTRHACPPYWDKISDQIMTRCGGLPLALVSVASMLEHRPSRDEWERLGLNLFSSSHMDGLKHALNLSYQDLPLHLKSCLLYLSIFPENYKVEVKRLVRLCTAEGFLSSDDLSRTGKEYGKKYLKELITGNLVQLEHTKNNHGTGSSWYFRLHPVIHDFIVSRSKEENFVSLKDGQHQHEPIHQKTIRRISIHRSDKQDESLVRNVTMDLSHAWSVTIFGQAAATPRLTDLSLFVRVLDLQGCSGPVCLDGLPNLRLLKYLSLRGTDVCELPATIGMLRYLRVLDVGFTKVKELPSSIGALRLLTYLSLRGADVSELPETIGKLRYLETLDVKPTKLTHLPGSIDSIETRTKIPVAIQHCQDLQKLVTVDLRDHLPSFIESLGRLWSLRVIALTWSFHQCNDEAYRTAFLSCISNWTDLTSLTIHCGLGCSMEFLGSQLSDPPTGLQKFKVTAGRFASVPKWISELNHLSFVQITICKQGTEQLKILGDLRELRRLILGLDFITENPILIESGWFRKLERFSVDCPRPWFSFCTGSMQRLTYLELKLCECPVRETSVPSGIDNLQSMKEVSLCYRSLEEHSPNIRLIVGAVRQAVTEHSNKIDLFINGTPEHYNAEVAKEEASSSAGTGIGTDAGITDDIQRTDDELVKATNGIQRMTEIEEIEIKD